MKKKESVLAFVLAGSTVLCGCSKKDVSVSNLKYEVKNYILAFDKSLIELGTSLSDAGVEIDKINK